jgi:hypothetical protein
MCRVGSSLLWLSWIASIYTIAYLANRKNSTPVEGEAVNEVSSVYLAFPLALLLISLGATELLEILNPHRQGKVFSLLYYREHRFHYFTMLASFGASVCLLVSLVSCFFLLHTTDDNGTGPIMFLLVAAMIWMLLQIPKLGISLGDIVFEQFHFDMIAIGAEPSELLQKNKVIKQKQAQPPKVSLYKKIGGDGEEGVEMTKKPQMSKKPQLQINVEESSDEEESGGSHEDDRE